jgi:hypothetical protein
MHSVKLQMQIINAHLENVGTRVVLIRLIVHVQRHLSHVIRHVQLMHSVKRPMLDIDVYLVNVEIIVALQLQTVYVILTGQ